MPSSAVHTFADPDDYGAAIRRTKAEIFEINVTGRGRFTGKIIRIDLHSLWMAAPLRQSAAGWSLGHYGRAGHFYIPH